MHCEVTSKYRMSLFFLHKPTFAWHFGDISPNFSFQVLPPSVDQVTSLRWRKSSMASRLPRRRLWRNRKITRANHEQVFLGFPSHAKQRFYSFFTSSSCAIATVLTYAYTVRSHCSQVGNALAAAVVVGSASSRLFSHTIAARARARTHALHRHTYTYFFLIALSLSYEGGAGKGWNVSSLFFFGRRATRYFFGCPSHFQTLLRCDITLFLSFSTQHTLAQRFSHK